MATMTFREEATDLLQRLIRLDTVNPPGNETLAAELLRDYLAESGVVAELYAKEPERANLVARIPGRGGGPRLLLLSHTDTVLADAAEWQFDPWSGEMREVIGFVRHVAIAIVRGRRQRPILKPPFVRGWLSFCDTAQNAAGQPFSDRKAFAAGGSSRGIPRLGRDTGDVPGKIGLQCHRHGWPQKKAQSQVRAAPLGVKRRSGGPK